MQAKGKLFKELWKYGLTGGIAYIVDLSTYLLIIFIDESSYLLGNIAGRCAGACAAFVLHRNWTFKSDSHKNATIVQGSLSLLFFLLNLLISSLALKYTVEDLALDDKTSRIAIDIGVIILAFICNKYIIFRER